MIAPITGAFRKRLTMDLSVGLGMAAAGGFGYWYGYIHPLHRAREAYYVKLEAETDNN